MVVPLIPKDQRAIQQPLTPNETARTFMKRGPMFLREHHTAKLVLKSGESPELAITCTMPDGGECGPYQIVAGSRKGERTCAVLDTWHDAWWDATVVDGTLELPVTLGVIFEHGGADYEADTFLHLSVQGR